jgi:hypothetical protein
MADDIAKIKIDTSVDTSGLEQGIKSLEETIKKSVESLEGTVEKITESTEKTVEKSAKTTEKTVEKSVKSTKDHIKDFAKGFGNELLGIDSLLQAVAGGPVAIGAKVAQMVQAGVAELNGYAEAWRKADEAAQKLAFAADSNPYINGKAVKELQAFADELENATGFDGDMMLAAETQLVSIGRTQEQITRILRTAVDLDASGLMSFNEAVFELNNSYNGLIRTSGRLVPEIRNLTREELAAGKAIDILSGKVEGNAARAMGTASGSVKAYDIAVSNLQKTIGAGWEEATQPARIWITDLITKMNEALNKQTELHDAFQDINTTAEQAFAIDSQKTIEIADRVSRAIFSIQNELQLGYIQDQQAITAISAALSELSALTGATPGQIGAIAEKYGDWTGFSPKIVEMTKKIIAQRKQVDEETKAILNRNAAIKEGDDRSKKTLQNLVETGRTLEAIRAKNDAALKAEIEKIKEQAAINGKNVKSAEIQRQIMSARVNAYYSLLEEGKDYIQILNREKDAKLTELTEGMAAVRNLEETEAEAERKRQEAARAEEERQAKRLRDIDDVIEAQNRLTASMSELANTAQIEREKHFRIEAVQEQLRAENDLWDEQLARRIAEIQTEKEFKLRTLEEELREQRTHNARVIQNIAEDTVLTEEEKAAKIQRITYQTALTQTNFENYRVELNDQANRQIEEANKEAAERETERQKAKYEKIASYIGTYSGYVQDAANAISDIWSNIIQSELDERLEALDKENLSAEERAQAEKKLRKIAADEQYKAALFQWGINMTMAAANAAQAVLAALANPGGLVGIALAAIAGAIGALQVAAIASAKPKKPTFHTGGVVGGSGEVNATLLGGEVVQTPEQFKNVMDAIANLAAIDTAKSASASPDIIVNNNAGTVAKVGEPQVNNNQIIFTIQQIVNDTIASGKANAAFERKDSYDRGQNLMTF